MTAARPVATTWSVVKEWVVLRRVMKRLGAML
jgi:hypothetical protein